MSRIDYSKVLDTQISDRIKKVTGKPTIFKYKKNDTGMYKTLQEYGNVTNAIKWAEALEKTYTGQQFAKYNPCTTVYKLVQELRGLSTSLKKEIEDKYMKGE